MKRARPVFSLIRLLHHSLPESQSSVVLPDSFSSLHLHSSVQSALQAAGITKATPLQTQAIPPILRGGTTLLAAEPGSGKTLAYLAPLISRLKARDDPVRSVSILTAPLPARPTTLILTPTCDLVRQVHDVAKALSHICRLRVRSYAGTRRSSRAVTAGLPRQAVDVLVTTPGGARALRARGALYTSRLTSVVLDEADELLSKRAGFRSDIDALLTPVRERVQCVYAAAAVPAAMENALRVWHGSDLSVVRGKGLHRASDAGLVRTRFISVSGRLQSKIDEMTNVVVEQMLANIGAKALVFCDRADRREFVAAALRDAGLDAMVLSNDAETTNATTSEGKAKKRSQWETFRTRESSAVGVCSGGYGRGLDDNTIRLVVLMDVPATGAAYLQRIGRLRGHGMAVVVVGRGQRAMARRLFAAQRARETMAGVQSSEVRRQVASGESVRWQNDARTRPSSKNHSRHVTWVDASSH